MTRDRPHIVQLSTVHPAQDTRVLHRECRALAEAGYRVTLIARCEAPFSLHGVSVQPVATQRSRLGRMLLAPWAAFRQAIALDPQAIHIHDPELLPMAVVYRALGQKVVYDRHEDVPLQVAEKPYLPRWLRPILAPVVATAEAVLFRLCSGRIAAEAPFLENLPRRDTVLLRNLVDLREFENSAPDPDAPPDFVYVGALSLLRGAVSMVDAIDQLRIDDARLHLIGPLQPPTLVDSLAARSGWSRTTWHGWQNRPEIAERLQQVRAGLCLLQPTEKYKRAWPVKLYEYMAAGLPVIVSDFPLWRGIVEDAGCGLLVDPTDPAAIAEAMQWILEHPEEARAMGRRGREAVEQKYDWAQEKQTLINFYSRLIGPPLGE